MAGEKVEVLLIGPPKPVIAKGLAAAFAVHRLDEAKDPAALVEEIAPRVRAIASSVSSKRIDGALMGRLPRLEILSTFGVGYDHVDVPWAVAQLRNRTVGMVGMGRIGQAIARRLDAMQVPVVYHSRRPAAGVSYRHYPKLIDMARDVDVLMVITPGGEETKNLVDAEVLEALGPEGILINMARGSVVDEPALIKALQERTIMSAGLDVYLREPEVPPELIAMEHVVLFPHLGSATVHTRDKMDQLVVDNLLAWAAGKPPLTPVPETPWPPKKRT